MDTDFVDVLCLLWPAPFVLLAGVFMVWGWDHWRR
jgi:hypothetical protein